MNNALKNLLDIFDVELNEEFCLTGYQAKFRITERGLEFYNLGDSAQGWQDNPDDISCIIKEQMLVYKPWHPPVGERYYVPCLDLLGYKEFVWGADEYLDTFYWTQGLVHKDIWEAEFVAKILRHKAMKYKRDVPDIIREER